MAMLLHRGDRYQAGRGIGSIFSFLFRGLKPLVSMGLKAGKKVLTSDLAKQVGSTAMDIGKSTLKNVVADVIEGTSPNDSLNKGLETAKSSIANQIRGSGRKRRRKRSHCKPHKTSKRVKFSLLDNASESDE